MNKVKEEIVIVDEKSIRDKIYIIRGQKVMIDSDLARIYNYSTHFNLIDTSRNFMRIYTSLFYII